MPKIKSKAIPFAQDEETGIYQTEDLRAGEFIRVFKQIENEQQRNREKAKRTLRPKHLARKSVEDLVKLGANKDGEPFTIEDLKRFDKMRKRFQKRRSKQKGISLAEAIGLANDRRIKRASNRMGDGRDILKAQILKLEKSNVVSIRVKASSKSKHDNHRVRIRMEDWQNELLDADGSDKGYTLAVKNACKGHFSIDCSCGDHQYRYRYMATIGGYALGSKEAAFPKVTNETLSGTVCKHVLHSLKRLQSPVWQNVLSHHMAIQARAVGFTNTGKGSTKTFGKRAQEELKKNRSSSISDSEVEKYKAQFQKMQQAEKSIQRMLKSGKADALKQARDKAKRLKAQVQQANEKAKRLQNQINKMKASAKANIQGKVKAQAQSAIELAMNFGATKEQAISAFAKQSGLSVAAINKVIE